MDLTRHSKLTFVRSLNAQVKTPRSKNFHSVEGVSQVRDDQKPAAATADATTAMSESTLRILAFYAQDLPFTDEAHQTDSSFCRNNHSR